jgi:hypothetical protein
MARLSLSSEAMAQIRGLEASSVVPLDLGGQQAFHGPAIQPAILPPTGELVIRGSEAELQESRIRRGISNLQPIGGPGLMPDGTNDATALFKKRNAYG